jgi:TolB protein
VRDPFLPENLELIPLAFVADAVLGKVDAVEISGLWLHELGASELLYRVLNIGVPLLPSAGTDAFPNFYRCSVVGSNRTYVHVDGACTLEKYFSNLRRGNCYVSSGPLVDFRIAGALPGETIKGRKVAWTLELSSTLPLMHLEILVNGRVVQSLPPLAAAGSIRLEGSLDLPKAGWVVFRAWDERSSWPSMNSRIFAHTAPHWIHRKGSIDPHSAHEAAKELLRAIESSMGTIEKSLTKEQQPRLMDQLREARKKLESY